MLSAEELLFRDPRSDGTSTEVFLALLEQGVTLAQGRVRKLLLLKQVVVPVTSLVLSRALSNDHLLRVPS